MFIVKNEIKVNGKQTVMGIETPVIERNRLIENIDYIDMFSNNSLKVTASDLGLITKKN